MLVLMRRPGETLVLGDNIRVTVVAVNGSQVKLAIDAPKEVKVMREELLARPRKPAHTGD